MAIDQLTQVANINTILNKTGQKLGINATQTTDASGTVKFSVKFNSGAFYNNGFLKENLGYIQKVLKPLDPIGDLLKTEIPLISDYKDTFYKLPINFDQDSDSSSISLLDVIGFAAQIKGQKADVKQIDEIFSFGNFLNKIPVGGGEINLGELIIDKAGNISQNPFSNISLPALDLPSTFNIPILKDPVNTTFGILLGKNETLFSYDAPKFKLEFPDPLALEFPVVGIVGGVLTGTFGAEIQLGFGFDTSGIQSGSFEDGFFVKDYPGNEVELSGEVGIGAYAGIPSIANLRATLDTNLALGFTINDPSPESPGVVRLNEIKDFSKIFKKPDPKFSIGLSADIVIAGSAIAGISSPKLGFGLDGFPPAEIEEKIDKVIGYIEQITSLKSFDPVARLEQFGDFVEDKADRFGKFTRKTADKFGGFVEDTFNDVGKLIGRLEKTGEKFVKTIFDGANRVSETIWDGTKTIFKQGGETIEWVDNKLRSILSNGKETLFNAAGDVVDQFGNVIQNGGDFLKGLGNSAGDGFVSAGNAIGDFFRLDGGDPTLPTPEPNPSLIRPNSSIIYRTDGSILMQTGIGADLLEGTKFGDEIRSGNGNDYVSGNGGRDLLYGEGGNDILNGGAGEDFLDGGIGNDTLKGGTDNDVLNGGANDDTLLGEAGIDTLNGGTGNDTLKGGNDNDFLFGGADEDTLDGEIGNDQLFGQEGNDRLLSSAGNDLLDGGADTDTVSYEKDPKGVIVNIDETQGYSNTAYPSDIEPTFSTASGTALDGFGGTDTLRNLENIIGSAYDDVLIGNSLKNTITGLDGNDLLIGNGGDDILDGGNGIDTVSYRRSVNSANIGVSVDLSTGVGFDGIDGLDTLISIENVIGSQFADRLTGNSQANTVLGGDGKDIIDGKEGNDRLFGENGKDEISGGSGDDFLVGGADADTIDGGANIDTVSYDDSPTGTIVNIDETQAYSNTAYPSDIEPTFTIASGTALDGFGSTDTLRNLENIIGSAYDDILIGNALKNTLNGLNGNDLLIGNGGDDILDGGNGTDTVSYRRSVNSSNIGVSVDLSTGVGFDGIDGLDTLISIENLIGSQFADRLIGSNQANTILGGDGNDIIDGKEGNDRLFGENGQDEIFGGSGNDYLVGGTGADLLDGGEGNDTASYITSTAGILASLVTKTGAFADAQGDRFISIENLEGSEYDDFLYGDENDNILSGLGGNDTIRGEAGDDRLDGGTGDNLLNAGEGNNTIVAADGKNTVYAESGNDSVLLGNGNNTVFAGKGDNSVVVGNGDNTVYAESGNDSIVVGNGNNTVFAGDGKNTITAGSGNDTIYGGAGTDVIDAGAGNNTVFAYDGQNIVLTQDGTDIIYGGAGRDFISAGGGNDTIFAGDGDNWIAAGTGNNLIYSGSGQNLFILEAGAGLSTIKNFAIGKDKLGLTAGLQPEQLKIAQVNSDGFFGTQISIAGSGDVLARLEWTSADRLTASSFTPNLPLANNPLISLFG